MPRKAASISSQMSNLPMSPDRVKTVHNSRGTICGYVTNDNDEERTACDEANDLKLIIAVLSRADQDEQEFSRPLPPPEPPPPPRRWPWPGTNKTSEPTKHVNGADHEIYAVKAPPGGVISHRWHSTTSTTIHPLAK